MAKILYLKSWLFSLDIWCNLQLAVGEEPMFCNVCQVRGKHAILGNR